MEYFDSFWKRMVFFTVLGIYAFPGEAADGAALTRSQVCVELHPGTHTYPTTPPHHQLLAAPA